MAEMRRQKEEGHSINILSHDKGGNTGGKVFSVSRKDKKEAWKVIHAAVDSGAVDTVGDPKEFLGIPVKATRESENE